MWCGLGALTLASIILLLGRAADAERTPFHVSLDAVGYEPVSNPPGLIVYKDPRSPLVRLGAEGWLPGSPRRLREVLTDYEHQVGQMGRLVQTRITERGPRWLKVYQRLKLPVVSDRDFTLLVRWGEDAGGVIWIAFVAVPDQPERPGVVRITTHSGSWQLRPLSGGGTFVRFQVTIDMAGSMPRWMARSGAVKEVPQIFASVCQMMRRKDEKGPTCSASR